MASTQTGYWMPLSVTNFWRSFPRVFGGFHADVDDRQFVFCNLVHKIPGEFALVLQFIFVGLGEVEEHRLSLEVLPRESLAVGPDHFGERGRTSFDEGVAGTFLRKKSSASIALNCSRIRAHLLELLGCAVLFVAVREHRILCVIIDLGAVVDSHREKGVGKLVVDCHLGDMDLAAGAEGCLLRRRRPRGSRRDFSG